VSDELVATVSVSLPNDEGGATGFCWYVSFASAEEFVAELREHLGPPSMVAASDEQGREEVERTFYKNSVIDSDLLEDGR
jgi:hypothetical protein